MLQQQLTAGKENDKLYRIYHTLGWSVLRDPSIVSINPLTVSDFINRFWTYADTADSTGSGTILLNFLCNRRKFVQKAGMLAAAGLLFPLSPKISLAALSPQERRLRIDSPHTGEKLRVCYCANGQYIESALEEVNHFFRDFRTGGINVIDVRLLDFLHAISKKIPNDKSFLLISGYRSPKTNSMLRAKSSGVARKSLHLMGHAADIRISGVKTAAVKKIAINLNLGGVGYYPKSDFVHVDIGRVRYW